MQDHPTGPRRCDQSLKGKGGRAWPAFCVAATLAAAALAEPAGPAEPIDAEFRAAAAHLLDALAPDRLAAVEITVLVAGPAGRKDRYPIYVRGDEGVAEVVTLLAAAKLERCGTAPVDPEARAKFEAALDCRISFDRNTDLVELEKRGEIFLDLLAEDEGRKRAKPPAIGATVRFRPVGDRLELLAPVDPRLLRATFQSDRLRARFKAAVDGDVKRAAEFWVDLPYGMARSSLAEGIAYAALGFPAEAAACWKRTVEICRGKGQWLYLAVDAEARLKALSAK